MMQRREFVTLVGGAAAWPIAARAQQPTMPVVGFLHPASFDTSAYRLRAFRQGLKDAGFVEGESVAVEYRWADNQVDRLPELAAKRLELLRDLVPRAIRIAALINPTEAASADSTLREVDAAALAMAMQIRVLNTSTLQEIDEAFAGFVRERPDALFVGAGPFLTDRRVQLAQLAARHNLPTVYVARFFVTAGGLISYGPDFLDEHRRAAGYVDRILKGEKAADLPVQAPTKYELVINLRTAKALGLEVPLSLLARADEMIE